MKPLFLVKSIKAFFLLFFVLLGINGWGQKLIISQVYEGASNNKWVEITNVGTTDINLASPVQYRLGIWAISGDSGVGSISGNPSNSIVLSGTLAPGQSYLMRHTNVTANVPHNEMPVANTHNTTVAGFNGDDALAIFTGTNTIVDAFGHGINNKDISYHRNASVLNSNTAFTLSEWTTRTLAQIAVADNTETEYIGKHIYGSSYTITATSNDTNMGTVSLSGSVITATPKPGYAYANPAYTVVSGAATVVKNDDQFIVTATANSTIRINFALATTYTLSLSNDGAPYSNSPFPYTTYAGNTVTLPTLPACGEFTFAGWSTSSTTTSAPTYAGGVSYTITPANVTLYAVYSKTTAGGGEVTATYGFEDGDTGWTSGATRSTTNPKTGSYSGSINTANVYTTFNSIVADPVSIKFSLRRGSSNNNYDVQVQTSPDNSNWTTRATYAMSGFGNGSYTERETDLSSYSNVFVRVYVRNTTAQRYIDDISITYGGGSTTTYTTTPGCAPQSQITLANNGTQVVTGNVTQGTAKHPISSFQLSASAASANLTEARFITSGNYTSTDVSAFKLWHSNTNNLASATQLGATHVSTSNGSGDIIEFTVLGQQIAQSLTRYFWVTADVTAGATAGRTMSLDAIANADLIFSSGTKTGSANAGGTQTIVANTIPSLAISGTPTAHGTVCVGTPATTRTYTITNNGATASGVTVSSNNPEFVVSNLSSTTIANGGTATFDVIFTPTTAGARAATITVASTTSGSNSPTLGLTGSGTANTTPTVTITSNPNTAICAGTSVTFTATAPSANLGGGTVSYQWKLNGSDVGGNTTTYTNAILVNGDVVSCVVTVTGGCVTSNTVSSNNITMTVNEAPLTPDGDIQLENPYCGSADLLYELGNRDKDNLANGVVYYWQTSATGTDTSNPMVVTPGAEVANPYNVTVSRIYYLRALKGTCWSTAYATGSAVTFVSAINVSTQPIDRSVNAGTTATFTVSATGSPAYQWQVSTNGGTTWSNIASATFASYITASTTLAMNGYKYRVRLSNSCGTITSNVATLSVNLNYCTAIGGTSNSGILRVVFNTIDQTSASNVAYTNNTSLTTSVQQGSQHSLRVNVNTNGNYTSYVVAWIDWNQNGTFDATERYQLGTIRNNANAQPSASPLNITVPAGAILGNTRMRISANTDNVVNGYADPCESFTHGEVEDYTINVFAACTPAVITASPTSGPVGTVVTITGSNFVTGSTVKFGTANAIVEYVSTTEIKATVPATADGNIIVDTALDCDSETAFTLIKENATGCEIVSGSGSGNAYASDLIFYEIYDENGGTGGTISIYNGTNATVNLSNYSFYRSNTAGTVAYTNYGTLSGTVASGELAIIGVSGDCTTVPSPTNGSINNGFNGDDGFQLRKNSGSTIVDEVLAPSYAGYYLIRKSGNLSPKPVYDSNDWTETSVASNQCLEGVGSETPGVKMPPPAITSQPTYTVSCEVNNTALTLTATEGYNGGNALAYQWYVLGTSGNNWTAVSNSGVYSGATTATLIINDITGLNNYQYYCQVRENTETCYTATQATQIKEAANTWTTASVWTNKTPVLASKVIIEGNYDTATNGELNVCELTVNAGGTMVVKADNPITIKKKIINNNTANNSFVVESDANIIQTDDVVNEGNILVQRSVADMNNVSTKMDYVYWSSPVDGQPIKGATAFSPNTPNSGFQQYNESNDRFVTTNDATFLKTKGYAIRAESGVIPGSNPPEQYQDGYNKTYTFTGIPNNGSFQSETLGKSAGADKGYNLIGNPYPSNIDFDKLHALNENKIYATAFFWTNNEYEPKQMGSGYKGNNYAIYNITGGVPATYDRINTNYGTAPNGKIKVGQAFMVQTKIAGTLDFNNSIRVTDSGTFYQKTQGKNRFWLSLTAPNNMVNTILVGYIPGATDLYENGFDAELLAVGSDSFYSILGARKLAIQGKSDSFSTEDVVTLGNVFSTDGNYTIKLQDPEGLFNDNQKVYLKDKLLKKHINLSSVGSYTFEAVKGTDHTRFEIVYKEGTLDTMDHNKSEFQVYKKGVDFVIQSSQKLGKVELYDAGGRLVRQLYSNEKNVTLEVNNLPQGVYIIKAENSGDVKTKKIIK